MPAVQSPGFVQKLDAMRRAGFDIVEDANFSAARGQFDGMQFTYNPAAMTRLDFSHEWRHFRQLNQMIDRGLSPAKSANMRVARAPAERGAYLYEERLWRRIGVTPKSDYLRFHAGKVEFFERGRTTTEVLLLSPTMLGGAELTGEVFNEAAGSFRSYSDPGASRCCCVGRRGATG